MANLFLPLPAPAGNGAGAAVDMNAFGSFKTITVSNLSGALVQIEISNDDAGLLFTPVGTRFQTVGEQTIQVACHWMRAVVSNYSGGGAPVVEVGGTNAGTLFAELDVPAGNGVGATVDTSTLGLFKTVQVTGPFTGVVSVEVSEDGGASFATAFSFSAGDDKSQIIAADAMRVRRSGAGVTPGLPLVNVAAVVVDAGGGGGAVPTPPFDIVNHIIYVRDTGSDTEGNGLTPATAYRTIPRAVRDVEIPSPPGATWFINCDGVHDTLPAQYELPRFLFPKAFTLNAAGTFRIVNGVNIQAEPINVPLAPPGDAVISVADLAGATITNDPITDLVTIALNASRPSWAGNAIKGKQVLGAAGGFENAVIYESSNVAGNATISITNNVAPTAPIRIAQPSCEILSDDPSRAFISAVNFDSLSFGGLKIADGPPGSITSIATDGVGDLTIQLCELDGPGIRSSANERTRIIRNWIYGFPVFGGQGGMLFNLGLMDAASSNFVRDQAVFPAFQFMVFDGCDSIEPLSIIGGLVGPMAVNMLMFNTLVRNGTGDGLIFHGVVGVVANCDFANNAGNGVSVVGGSGYLELDNVGSSLPNGAFGLQVDDGMNVAVDANTSGNPTPLTGPSGDWVCGTLGPDTWANFILGGGNEFDVAPTGTGSRLYQI